MKLLKNRNFAILLTIIVAVLATLFGVGRSLNRLTRNVEAMYYIDVDEYGIKQPDIDHLLSNRANTALALLPVFDNYPELKDEADALRAARQELLAAKDIPEKALSNARLQQAFETLAEKSGRLDLSERDRNIINMHSDDFSGAQTAILNSRYNRNVSSYMDGASFLAQALKPFVFVRPPQAFA